MAKRNKETSGTGQPAPQSAAEDTPRYADRETSRKPMIGDTVLYTLPPQAKQHGDVRPAVVSKLGGDEANPLEVTLHVFGCKSDWKPSEHKGPIYEESHVPYDRGQAEGTWCYPDETTEKGEEVE